MPAAAVIPAPIAYTNFAAVKMLLVEFVGLLSGTDAVRSVCVPVRDSSFWRSLSAFH